MSFVTLQNITNSLFKLVALAGGDEAQTEPDFSCCRIDYRTVSVRRPPLRLPLFDRKSTPGAMKNTNVMSATADLDSISASLQTLATPRLPDFGKRGCVRPQRLRYAAEGLCAGAHRALPLQTKGPQWLLWHGCAQGCFSCPHLPLSQTSLDRSCFITSDVRARFKPRTNYSPKSEFQQCNRASRWYCCPPTRRLTS